MRIGMRVGRVWISGAVSAAVFTIGFFIKMAIFLVLFGVFMAFVAPPMVQLVLDKTTSEENKKIQRETAIYQAKLRELQATYKERHAESNAAHNEAVRKRQMGIATDEIIIEDSTGAAIPSNGGGFTIEQIAEIKKQEAQALSNKLMEHYGMKPKEFAR